MIDELNNVLGILESIEVNGRYWLAMVACTNSIKNVIGELEKGGASDERTDGDSA